MPCHEMEPELLDLAQQPRSPRHSTPRLARKNSPSAPEEAARPRLKSEINLTRELIDFDLIKGSALFHTKPSSHDRKLVQEGFSRALLVPLHAKFWRQKPWFYEIATALYALHGVALGIYLYFPEHTSALSGFELLFPVCLLLLVAIGYGRVSSTLQAGDSEPSLKIMSPTKHAPQHSASTASDVTTASGTSGLGSDLAESENSDSTDSEEDSGNSSSSSDEETSQNENMFEPASSASTPANTPTNSFTAVPSASPMNKPASPHLPRTMSEREVGGDQFSRRRVTVCVWEDGFPTKKAMSIAELRNTILAKVKATPPRLLYRKIAKLSAAIIAVVPVALRCVIKCQEVDCLSVSENPLQLIETWKRFSINQLVVDIRAIPYGASIIALSSMLSTYYLASAIFSALADAEVTYHRRFLYAKCFTALTSSRRSRLANLPHFRLKNVVNIKAWISLRGGRTWLKRQGRQRAADEIVSTAFLIILVLLVVMGVQAVSESSGGLSTQSIAHIEVVVWCMLSSIFLLRFMMLGSNINKKYQNTSLLLTEQMNVYLRLLVKPHKKEKLLVSNNVLKLASKLLKELNSPNKVSGLTMNPLLYNITRVVVLSAFSSTASEFFGFKLKLWKLKA